MRINRLSIVIPCFNEKDTIELLLQRISKLDLSPTEKEVILVDDGSTDGTRKILRNFNRANHLKIFFHERNAGKGGAIRTALNYVTGDYIIIQDADLEYDLNDLKKMVTCAEKNNLDVLYGSRNLKINQRSSPLFHLGGKFLTWLANLLYGSNITDEPTCYKLIKTDLIKKMKLRCKGFDFCPEVTAKLARLGCDIQEIPISYFPRKIREGKKIRYFHGVQAIWILLKYKFWKPSI